MHFLPIPYIQEGISGWASGESGSEILKRWGKISIKEEIMVGLVFSLSMQIKRERIFDEAMSSLKPDNIKQIEPVTDANGSE